MIFVTKRKNILIILCMAIFLVACYMMLRYGFVRAPEEIVPESDNKRVSTEISMGFSDFQAIGDENADFFIDYKLERDRLRGQEADYLRELINNPNASSESKEKAQQDLIELSKKVEKEMIAENLIKAKGFEDAILFFSDDFINIVVKSDGLQTQDIAKITDAITKSTGVGLDKITIIERK